MQLRFSLISILCIILHFSVSSQIQQRAIRGVITLKDDRPAAGALIEVRKLQINTKTDAQGRFSIPIKEAGTYTLHIHYLGTLDKEVQVEYSADNTGDLKIVLDEDIKTIDMITVTGYNATQRARDQVIKAQVIDTKVAQQQSATLVEMMNRSAGIRIRQSGGLGSNTNIMLNGFQGKSIKTFKDGIPTDYLGAAFNLSNIPINMLEHVEVYKGVLPTSLGADALGGAVNFVSRQDGRRALAVSYELASFNTHRASLNWQHQFSDQKGFVGLEAFYNYSDNSYHVTAGIPDPETANVVPERIKLFHNAYNQIYAEAYGGIRDVFWADELRIGITAFRIHRDNQFAALMERPFGASYSKQKTPFIPSLRYKKSLFDDRLKVDQFLVYSRINSLLADTLEGSYNWYGQYVPPVNPGKRGEAASASLADITFSNFTSRTGLHYHINDSHQLAFNSVFNAYRRTGSDPFGAISAGENPVDLLSLPADYDKLIVTLGLNSSFLNKKLQNVFQVKYYQANAVGQEVNVSTGLLKENTSTASSRTVGLAEALKYALSPHAFIRVSGEWATRLPEQSEILGDGAYILSNFNLKPERSINGNLGFGYNRENRHGVEVNSFYRITKDMMLSVPMNLLYSQSTNVEQVRGIGLEVDAFTKPFPWLRLNGNFTYQDFRLYNVTEPSILYLEGARLRNVPFFFANLGANAGFENVFSANDRLQTYWNLSYVHQYYLNYIPKDTEPDGFLGLWGNAKIDAPNIIPKQIQHFAGLVYIPGRNNNLSINLECKNVLDAEIFDNFRIQNAGRSFHLKLNYILNY